MSRMCPYCNVIILSMPHELGHRYGQKHNFINCPGSSEQPITTTKEMYEIGFDDGMRGTMQRDDSNFYISGWNAGREICNQQSGFDDGIHNYQHRINDSNYFEPKTNDANYMEGWNRAKEKIKKDIEEREEQRGFREGTVCDQPRDNNASYMKGWNRAKGNIKEEEERGFKEAAMFYYPRYDDASYMKGWNRAKEKIKSMRKKWLEE